MKQNLIFATILLMILAGALGIIGFLFFGSPVLLLGGIGLIFSSVVTTVNT